MILSIVCISEKVLILRCFSSFPSFDKFPKTQNEKYTMFSGNPFYHEKGKAVYHFGKSSENRDFIKFSVITPKNRYFFAK